MAGELGKRKRVDNDDDDTSEQINGEPQAQPPPEKKTRTKGKCPHCDQQYANVQRHIRAEHLPKNAKTYWYCYGCRTDPKEAWKFYRHLPGCLNESNGVDRVVRGFEKRGLRIPPKLAEEYARLNPSRKRKRKDKEDETTDDDSNASGRSGEEDPDEEETPRNQEKTDMQYNEDDEDAGHDAEPSAAGSLTAILPDPDPLDEPQTQLFQIGKKFIMVTYTIDAAEPLSVEELPGEPDHCIPTLRVDNAGKDVVNTCSCGGVGHWRPPGPPQPEFSQSMGIDPKLI